MRAIIALAVLVGCAETEKQQRQRQLETETTETETTVTENTTTDGTKVPPLKVLHLQPPQRLLIPPVPVANPLYRRTNNNNRWLPDPYVGRGLPVFLGR
jgi:hypothetical protein